MTYSTSFPVRATQAALDTFKLCSAEKRFVGAFYFLLIFFFLGGINSELVLACRQQLGKGADSLSVALLLQFLDGQIPGWPAFTEY